MKIPTLLETVGKAGVVSLAMFGGAAPSASAAAPAKSAAPLSDYPLAFGNVTAKGMCPANFTTPLSTIERNAILFVDPISKDEARTEDGVAEDEEVLSQEERIEEYFALMRQGVKDTPETSWGAWFSQKVRSLFFGESEFERLFKKVEQNPSLIEKIDPNTPDFDKLALYVVQRRGNFLEAIPSTTPNYPAIAWAAVKENPYALEHVVSSRLSDKDYFKLALCALTRQPSRIEKIDPNTPNFDKLALYVVQRRGNFLEAIPSTTPNYPAIAWAAVKENPYALKYVVSSRLSDEDYVKLAFYALKRQTSVIKHVDFGKPGSDMLALYAVKRNCLLLEYIPDTTPNYFVIVCAAIEKYPKAIELAMALGMEPDAQTMFEAIKHNPEAVRVIPFELEADKKFMSAVRALLATKGIC